MRFRKLGRTGLEVSVLGIGTWQLSGTLTLDGRADGFPDPGRERVIDLIRACGDLGINLMDTAEVYGDGEGERRIGSAIRGRRDRWIIASKFGVRRGPHGQRVTDVRGPTIRRSLEGTLQRLQTDYLDIFLYHAAPQPEFTPEGRRVLEDLKGAGKIRFAGISTNDPGALRQLLEPPAVDVVMVSRSLLTEPGRVLKLAKRHNLGILVRGALQGGRLSGRYFHRRPRFPVEDVRSHAFREVDLGSYSSFERLLPNGVPMSVFALRYLLDFETTHAIVLGGTSLAEYREALEAVELPPLDPPTHRRLRRLRRRWGRGSLPRRILRGILRT